MGYLNEGILEIIGAIITLGFLCGKKHIFKENQIEAFEIFLFKIAIPCYLFTAILNNSFSSLINLQYVYSYILTFSILAIITAFYFWRTSSISEICINILASGYVNAAIYVLPVITFLLDNPQSAILGNLIQVIIIQSAFLVILNVFKHRESSIGRRLLMSFKSPIISLPIFAIMLNYYKLDIGFIKNVTGDLGNGAAGMALFTFGLSLSNVNIKRENLNKDLCFMILVKNILHPTIAVLIGSYIFSLDKYWLYSLIIAASAPTAFVIYLISKQFNNNTHSVKIIVSISSVFSLISLAGIIFMLSAYS